MAPYIYWFASQHSLGLALCVLASLVVPVLLAMAAEKFNHAGLIRKGASSGAHLVSSLGIYVLLVQVIAILWGNDVKTLRTGIDVTLILGPTVLTGGQLLTAATAILLLGTLIVTLHGTEVGLRLRALADNPMRFAC